MQVKKRVSLRARGGTPHGPDDLDIESVAQTLEQTTAKAVAAFDRKADLILESLHRVEQLLGRIAVVVERKEDA